MSDDEGVFLPEPGHGQAGSEDDDDALVLALPAAGRSLPDARGRHRVAHAGAGEFVAWLLCTCEQANQAGIIDRALPSMDPGAVSVIGLISCSWEFSPTGDAQQHEPAAS